MDITPFKEASDELLKPYEDHIELSLEATEKDYLTFDTPEKKAEGLVILKNKYKECCEIILDSRFKYLNRSKQIFYVSLREGIKRFAEKHKIDLK